MKTIGSLPMASVLLVAGLLTAAVVTPSRGLPGAFAIDSQADDSFAICTAPVDVANSIEGIFVLDFATGDLTGGVLNAASATFGTSYKRNVLNDLGFQPGQAKNPRFLLVAGQAELRPNPRLGRRQFAASVIYVTDCTTGATAAYAIPWSPQQAAAAAPAAAELVLLDVARPRGLAVP
jgi:hypothetical protein